MAYFQELPNISYPSLLSANNKVEDRIIVKNIFNLQYKISEDKIKIEKKLYKIEDDLNKILNEIKKASALKNYYILSSIFSQILSLLILLILFRHLLLNIKKRK